MSLWKSLFPILSSGFPACTRVRWHCPDIQRWVWEFLSTQGMGQVFLGRYPILSNISVPPELAVKKWAIYSHMVKPYVHAEISMVYKYQWRFSTVFANLTCILSYWSQAKQAMAVTQFLPLLLHLQVWFCQPAIGEGLNPSYQSCSMRDVQSRKGLCRDVRPTAGVAEPLSCGYEQLDSAARSRIVLRAPAPWCQNSCFFWPWVTLAVVLKFKRLPTDKGNLLFPLAWQNISVSVHILSGSQSNLLSCHTPTLRPTLRGKGCVFMPLLEPVELPGCDGERREGKELRHFWGNWCSGVLVKVEQRDVLAPAVLQSR